MTGGSADPANSNAGDRRNDILELARAIREADNQKAQLPKVQVPLFDGTNASAWAAKFEQLGSCCEWTSEKMLEMVKRYCMVEYKEEVSKLVQASHDWLDFKAKLLDKYQLGDQLLNLADLRKVQVGPCEYSALIDDGAEMNIIREREAMGPGVNINRADTGFQVGASGITPFCGMTSDMTIQVGKVKVRSYFYVLPNVEHAVLLGRAFLCRSESIIFNKHDGTMIVVLCDPVCGYYEVMKCENTGPTNSRNRLNPGSYFFTESGRLRREKESIGEESDPLKFSLALPNISQGIEFVATDSSVDPKLVQTLTEIVAEEGETGKMYLTYRPDRSSEGDVLTEPAAKQGSFLEVDDLELVRNRRAESGTDPMSAE
ncbi:hypothetical protein CBR_g74483 [Chara braunii]|uniref:Peptidase A2 domain-containing protein n=1 Tax=Chara braunii TaxID=69332 RepID=A0A388JJ93_CHABU|nr:hypothetical protein CBR_g74483 [Chara braunii]|eukprot:GBG41471.1 hypothetical protein CBR_g74483 [Chara braunii]